MRDIKEIEFTCWYDYFQWSAIQSKDDRIKVTGLSEFGDNIKAEYIELF